MLPAFRGKAALGGVALLVAAAVGGGGCRTSTARTNPETIATAAPPDDRLGLDDVVDVRVYGEPDMTGSYRIGADGTFDFPLAGRIAAKGLTPSELQSLLVAKLKGPILTAPQVTVMAKERNSRSKVSVLGQVQHPGPVSFYPNMTIVDAVASAGGFTAIAAKNSVTLRREIGGKVELKTYPVADISEGRSVNVPLLPGDVVVVDERFF